MADERPNLTHHLVLSAVGGIVVNGLLQLLVAYFLVEGFRIDWYVHPPHASFERDFVLKDAFFSGLTVGGVAAAIAALLAYRAYDHGKIRVGRIDRWEGAPVPRDTHVLSTALVSGLGLGVFVTLNLLILFTAYRSETISSQAFYLIKLSIGAVAGGVASWIVTGATARGLASGRLKQTPPGENLIGALALASSRRPGRVVALVLAVTLIMAVGVSAIDTNVDVADVLPRGNHNTDAAHNLTDKFKSSFTQQVTLQFRTNPEQFAADNAKFLPNRRTTATPDNITDELYMRALQQAVEFIVSHPPFRYSVAGPDFFSLVNWTLAGGQGADPSSYALPGTDPAGAAQFAVVEQGVRRTIVFSSLDALVSPKWDQTAALILVSPQEPMSSREIGERALEVRDLYVEWAEANPDEAYQVFTGANAPLFTVDLPVANAHSSELTKDDFRLLLPLIGYFIVLCLFLAFRHPSYILVAFSSLAVSTIWTFGAMGYLEIPLNTLNLTTVPLIMGVGIDYGIHMMNEFQSNRARGLSTAQAFHHAGGHGAFALFVATLTTILGLAVMVMSPSLLIAQLGILSIIAIASCFLLAVSFIPAGIALWGPRARGSRKYRENVSVPRIARHVGRHRVLYTVVLVALSAGAAVSSSMLVNEPFGDPARNYLPDDPIRQEHEQSLRGFYSLAEPDVKANVLVFQGNVNSPEAHEFMDGVEASLRTKPLVIADTLRSLPFLMRTWLTVKDGASSVAEFTVRQNLYQRSANTAIDPYPTTQEELEAETAAVFASPLRGFGALFVDYPDNEIGVMVFSVRADTYAEAEEVWAQVWEAVDENRDKQPADLRVSFVGNTATNYLFVAEEVPWLGYMAIVVNVAVIVIVFASTRSVRLSALVGIANFVTSLLWLGMLPLLGVGLAITLALPLVFIFAMGSDYVLHLGLACELADRTDGTRHGAYATYGKGVLFSFLTTLGAFLIFTQISNLAVRKTMIATTAAIIMIFVVTLLLVPLFYPPGKGADAPRPAEAAAAAKELPRVTVVEAAGER